MYGCLPPLKDLRNYKIKARSTYLPVEFQLPKYQGIKDQKNTYSCVAHAISSVLEYHAKGQYILSTEFIYGHNQRNYKGMTIADACKIVQQNGDMLLMDCMGNNEIPKCFETVKKISSDKDKLEVAKYFKIDSYFDCDNIEDIKYAIMKYGPVVASIRWYDHYKVDKRTGIIEFDLNSTTFNHAVVIYGWNKNGFICQNSWGIYFGINGTFILPYEYKTMEAKCLVDHIPSPSEHIVIPKNNKLFDKGYKALNFVINSF